MCRCGCRVESPATLSGGSDPRLSRLWQEPTRAERKELLKAFQKRLEDRLTEVKDDLSKLE